jgi:hypothetical protein
LQGLLDRALLGSAFLLGGVYSLRRLTDSDLWHHLRCGEYFYRTGSVLRSMRFTAIHADEPFLNHEWLFQAVIYPLNRWGGEPVLMALQVALVLTALAILYRTLRLVSDNHALIALVLALGVAASAHRLALRPQHLSYVLLALLLHSLHRFQRGRPRLLWATPALMLAWVNLHGECLWALAIPGLFLATELTKDLWRGAGPRRLAPVAAVLVLTAAVSLANPFGWRTVVWPLIVMREMSGGVEELLSPTSPRFAFFCAYGLLALAAVAWRPRRVDPTWAALSVVFAGVAWHANRGIPHFVLVSAPLVVGCLDDGLRSLRVGGAVRLATRGALLAATLGLALAVVRSPLYLRPYDGVAYPEGGVRFLTAQGVSGGVMSEHLWGGFLLWNGYPNLRPVIDGRFYKKTDFAEFAAVRAAAPGWQQALQGWNVTVALLRYSESERPWLADALSASPDWTLVHWDDASLAFVRNLPERAPLIEAFGNRLVNPDRQLLFLYPSTPVEQVRQSRDAARRGLLASPRSYRAHILVANAAFALGDFAEAAREYQSALAVIDPPNAWLHYQLARSRIGLRDYAAAQASLERCLALAPAFEEGRRLLAQMIDRQRR